MHIQNLLKEVGMELMKFTKKSSKYIFDTEIMLFTTFYLVLKVVLEFLCS